MAAVHLRGVSRRYPKTSQPAVNNLDLEIRDGEFLVLVGPSGCGKSTTLRLIAGLEAMDTGSVTIDGKDVTDLDSKDREVAMVFQSYALYPHMSVAENMGFSLKVSGFGEQERDARVREVAQLLELEDLLERKPKELSGGQKQRVAMGRAIVRKPKIFLMDEPLSNLDAKLRVTTRTRISQLQKDLGITTLYVTHDQAEAMTMGTRVAVMNQGQIVQIDSPQAIYDRPVNTFVATFVGTPAMNLLKVTPEAAAGSFGKKVSAPALVGIRPDHWRVTTQGIGVKVTMVESVGSDAFAYAVPTSADVELVDSEFMIFRTTSKEAPAVGDQLFISPTDVHLFDISTGLLIISN